MEAFIIFAFLFFVWLVITVVGHGSWVLVRSIFGASSGHGPHQDGDPPPARPTSTGELEPHELRTFRRVVTKMRERKLITDVEAVSLFGKLPSLAETTNRTLVERQEELNAAKRRATEGVPKRSVKPLKAELVHPLDADSEPVRSGLESQRARPVAAVDAAQGGRSPGGTATPRTESSPATEDKTVQIEADVVGGKASSSSRSEVIRSFLAEHNIRWGELVAGSMIVICSIGLVVSLWNTLTQTHRVIPSLIFLAGNACIYGMGLYTLSRWKLRHSSRTVLVIATLLVPLSILSGLATAGSTTEAVRLDDPVTVAAIAASAIAYGTLLLLGGRGLVGRIHARWLLLAVSAPAALLPFVPATVRSWGDQAGWLVGLGAVFLAVGLVADVRLHRRLIRDSKANLGKAQERNRLVTVGLSLFAFATLIGYAGFLLRDSVPEAWLAIAVSSIPGWLAISGLTRWLAVHSRSGTMAMAETVAATVGVGIVAAFLIPAMTSTGWLLAWGVVTTASGMAISYSLRRPGWIAAATIPLALAMTLSSSTWMGDRVWGETSVWQALVCGEAMVSALGSAIVLGAASRFVSTKLQRTFGRVASGWLALAILLAAVLTFGPKVWLGATPTWLPTLVLCVTFVAATIASSRDRHCAVLTSLCGGILCGDLMRRATPALSLETFDWHWWMWLCLAFVGSSLGAALSLRMVGRLTASFSRDSVASRWFWAELSLAASVFAAGFALLDLGSSWQRAAAGLAAAGLFVFLTAIIRPGIGRFLVSQGCSFLAAGVLAYGLAGEQLLSRASWLSGEAIWNWIGLGSVVALLWFAIREVLALPGRALRRGSRPFRARHPLPGLDELTANVAVLPLLLATLVCYFGLAPPMQVELGINWRPGLLPFAPVLILVGLSSAWAHRLGLNAGQVGHRWIPYCTAIAIAFAVESSLQILSDPTWLLGVATSISIAGCLIILAFHAKRGGSTYSKAHVIPAVCGGVILAYGSAILLHLGWLQPIVRGRLADPVATVTVATWWLLGGSASLLIANFYRSKVGETVSAIIIPMAVAILVPVFSPSQPISWLQATVPASVTWLALRRYLFGSQRSMGASPAADGTRAWIWGMGLISAIVATFAVLFDWRTMQLGSGWMGFTASASGLMVLASRTLGGSPWEVRRDQSGRSLHRRREWLSPAMLISVLSGHIAFLLSTQLTSMQGRGISTLVVLWCLAAVYSSIRVALRVRRSRAPSRAIIADFWHAGGLITCILLIALTAGRDDVATAIAGMVAAVVGVALVGMASSIEPATVGVSRAARAGGWIVLALGASVLVYGPLNLTTTIAAGSLCLFWWTACLLVWRVRWPDISPGGPRMTALPDGEIVVPMLAVMTFEAANLFTVSTMSFGGTTSGDPLFWLRIGCGFTVVATPFLRAERRAAWLAAVGMAVVSVSIVGGKVGLQFGATTAMRQAIMMLTSGAALAVWARVTPALIRLAVGSAADGEDSRRNRWLNIAYLTEATLVFATLLGGGGAWLSLSLMTDNVDAGAVHLAIAGVALIALALVELAELSGRERVRRGAVMMGLTCVALWSTYTNQETHRWLSASMQWLVAATLLIPTLLFLLPTLLGDRLARRWSAALKTGAMVCSAAACAALSLMILLEFRLRTASGIDAVQDAVIIGVAITLGALSFLAALASILSWRREHGAERQRIVLPDAQRKWLIIAAQVAGAVTWLHLYLCRPQWAFAGLREFWPYVVMTLSFVSVGVTEWARRRGDQVLSNTLSQTALYLPLVPVIGFWLSGSTPGNEWAFAGSDVPYQWLLLVGAGYYLLVAILWRKSEAKIGTILLANGAVWVSLAQMPGWDFLVHPQAWLIPPAVCVLIVAHLYRERIPDATCSAIRYGATLVIYISSTADMLIADIGETLAGPIVLVLLALVGMGVGVVLRVKPFLYLGAAFVLVATTSMVWHAQQAIDRTWPWWAFGITLGLLLLGALMTLEKNKPRLRAYADTLAGWEG